MRKYRTSFTLNQQNVDKLNYLAQKYDRSLSYILRAIIEGISKDAELIIKYDEIKNTKNARIE